MLAVCDICGEQYGEYRHSYVMDEAVEATCTQTGKTEGRHCSVCGYVDVKQEIIKKKNIFGMKVLQLMRLPSKRRDERIYLRYLWRKEIRNYSI